MNEQQPQYFDVTAPAPTPVPWWKTWKLALPIGGAVLAVLVAVFVINTLASRTDGTVQEQQQALSRMDQELAACDSERDPEACKARVRNDAAQNGGGEDACAGLDADAYGSCVSLSAKASSDADACVSLAGEERTACEDLAYFTLGEREGDKEICDKIEDLGLRTSCTMRVIADAVAGDNCAAAHVDESFCVAAKAMRNAIASGDAAQCVALDNEDHQAECMSGIESTDEDGDGLVVKDEFAAGTSDNNADTDGDGYTDSEELANGHDPLM